MVRGMVREEVGEICTRIRIKVGIKVKVKVSTPVDRDMVVKGMDKIHMAINTNTRTKDTRTKISIEDKAKVILEVPDHTIRINTILDSMLVQVIYHLQTLLRGIILRTFPCPLLTLFLSLSPLTSPLIRFLLSLRSHSSSHTHPPEIGGS